MNFPARLRRLAGLVSLGLAVLGCEPEEEKQKQQNSAQQKKEQTPAEQQGSGAQAADAAGKGQGKPSAKEMRKKISALPPQEKIDKVVNPLGREPYQGETGTVVGLVRSTGDEPITLKQALANMKPSCNLSREMFAQTPREGKERALADAFVAVTGYDGYVPAEDEVVTVRAAGCAWDRRTVGMTFGQNLQIQAADNRAYVPELLGQPMPAQLFVLPNADPVHIPPRKPGQYRLVDSMRLFNVANVIVVPYPTFDVTGLDGKFEISGIPVGSAKINAMLPATGAVTGRDIEIEAGEVTEVTLELPFDAEALRKSMDGDPEK